MKHFKDLFSILCLLFITSAFVACDDDNDEYATDDETILSVPQDDLIFTYEGEAKTINVTASENTFVASVTTGDETWAHVSTANNSVKIVVDENVTLPNFAPFFLFFNLRSNREPCGFCFTLRLFSSKAFVSNFFFSLMHFTSYLLLSKYCFNSSTSFTMTSAPASCNSSSSP